ncbi:2-oxoacid_dh-domain-containing protein [Fragilariopsis cylindrus CCMP1102]|uniref:Dihydrolipoamide acetyltransferase component of pyruvate dehydrogenase complex n=1 Tax=Fragilariopsis cylindrus CCMP1102 TaxID=635003 RepID=A0A1E7FSH3_9STRA|nr:2-oxoacid_dh-domain-containing protein [Fragilariopsis cylindrus CCMP1102]|eukprot:OEU21088.1 2-oxoacid_dh-domain-containing protein [Fragilariopsis cylindrus CCMP1102]
MLARRRICIAASTSSVSTRLIGVGHNSNSNYNRLSLSEINDVNSKYRRQFHSSTVVSKDDYPVHTVLPFPALSPTMETGTIANWELSEGDEFSAGSVLCSIETDKATMDYEAQDDGFIAKILRDGPDASDLPIGTPIAIVVEELEDVAAFADYVVLEDEGNAGVGDVSASSADAPIAPTSGSTTAAPVAGGDSGTSFLLPSARFLAESKGLDATGLKGSGKGGRVTKGDVLAAIRDGTPMPALAIPTGPVVDLPLPEVDTYGTYEDVPNNNMRKIVAKRLTFSKQEVPCTYTSMEVELDNVMKLRKQLLKDHDIKVSVNDIVVRCSAMALRDVPEANGSYDPKTDTVKLQDSIDISIAVAIPNGLITPIVMNTDKLGLTEISDKVRDLAGRARDGKLAPEEYTGGTFCISNLGMFGIDEFTAIVNPPQAAILAVGGGVKRIVPTPYVDGAEEQAKPTIKTIMTARLSSDRRVIDEATASLFLLAFKHYINKPELLLL